MLDFDFARPEDIFGSLEVDGHGVMEGNGNYQPSGMLLFPVLLSVCDVMLTYIAPGTYRIITRNGM